jgi:hypothetical protein
MGGESNKLDERAEFTRQIALILLDVTAQQMAVRQLLYDAHLATEEKYQKAYALTFQGHFAGIHEALLAADSARLKSILAALAKTPYRT